MNVYFLDTFSFQTNMQTEQTNFSGRIFSENIVDIKKGCKFTFALNMQLAKQSKIKSNLTKYFFLLMVL